MNSNPKPDTIATVYTASLTQAGLDMFESLLVRDTSVETTPGWLTRMLGYISDEISKKDV